MCINSICLIHLIVKRPQREHKLKTSLSVGAQMYLGFSLCPQTVLGGHAVFRLESSVRQVQGINRAQPIPSSS